MIYIFQTLNFTFIRSFNAYHECALELFGHFLKNSNAQISIKTNYIVSTHNIV